VEAHRVEPGSVRQRLTSWPFWGQVLRLQVGLFLFGSAVALMLEANIGLDPWSAFHDALSARSGLSFGRIAQGLGLVLIIFSRFVLDVRPGLGTICNMLLVGPWIDLMRQVAWFPTAPTYALGVVQFIGAILVLGVATAVYIGARLGTGPRDGLVMGLARKIDRSIRMTRNSVEVTVLIVAAFLGGSIGLGTLLFAVLIGPTMQAGLKLFSVSHDPSPDRSPA
jgi:uncharacterized membrane protein YczE